VITVAVVDDQALVRQGIRSLLGLVNDIEVIGEAADGEASLALVEAQRPDVLLLDLQMPRRDGIDTITELRQRGHVLPVLVLTTFDDEELVLAAVQAGAHGYLLKDVTFEQLTDAVRTLAEGHTLVQPAITEQLLRRVEETPRPITLDGLARPEPLTERELEVLRLMASGFPNREIAAALHLAPGTVKNHVSAILMKLGVDDRTRAVLRALDLGLLTGPARGR
jgi:DNA-binding NarL/FixJ family response regulator